MRVYYLGHLGRAVHPGFWIFGAGWLVGIIFWILIIGALVVLFESLFDQPSQTLSSSNRPPVVAPSSDRALVILRERYARGDISQDQFSRMRQDLEV